MKLLIAALLAVGCGSSPCFSNGTHTLHATPTDVHPAGCTASQPMDVTFVVSSTGTVDNIEITESSGQTAQVRVDQVACPVFAAWIDRTTSPQVAHEYYLSNSSSSLDVVQFLTAAPWACTVSYTLR